MYQQNSFFALELPSSPGSEDKHKELPELLAELKTSNGGNAAFLALIDQLKHTVTSINDSFLNPSHLILSRSKETERLTTTPIKNWGPDDIKEWSKAIRKQPITNNALPEILAVIKQAVKCSEGFLPRDIQLLSVLSLLLKGNSHGRLAQIYTGEGKTTTIAMIAVVLVLQQKKVDIVTSSEVLARRDANDKATFYNLFGISVAENCSDLRMGPKQCYKADVVYGDTLNFQGDILCDEYQQLNTRCKRPFDMVIVDEVDSMLIDERLRMTRLSSPIPGMSALTPALEMIWRLVRRIHHSLTHGQEVKFGELDPAVLVKLHLKEEIEKLKGDIEKNIPVYLREYVITQATTWSFNAAHALLTYKENVHYVKRDDQIIPVDYKSTGTFQHRMHWGEGLHQFLQMKHDLPVDPINLTTNFLSNVTFFQRYRTNIVGLTGTLGSQSEQALLQNLYTLDSIHIPSYKLRKLQETPGIILRENKSWLEAIKASILAEATKGRAVLVICETIQKVNAIQDTLTDYDQTLVHPYIENTEEEQAHIHGELQPRQIIIATNLAGRGTDLKISPALEKNGGLHVIVAFLPENKRVEDQAFGRAGRQGSPGTAQLIININDETTRLTYSKYKNIDEIKAARDAREKRLLDLAAKETQKVVNKDKLFTEFCQLMHYVKKQSENHKETLDALEERWGFWLLALTDEHLLTDKHKELFLKFKEDILKDYQAGKIIQNPKYYLRHGHKKFAAQQYKEALQLYITAFEMNQLDGYPVYYQALAIIKLQEQSKNPTQLVEVIKLLDEAIRLCGDDLGYYRGFQKGHQKKLQPTRGEQEAETTEDDVKIQHLPLLQRTLKEDSSTQLQLGQALQPIDSIDISATSCSRYDNLIIVRNNIMEEIIKLRIEAKQALEADRVLEINIKAITQLYNSQHSKPISKALDADGFPDVALPVGKEISLFPVFCTGAFGIAELVTGIVLCATGVGAIWGYGLIIESAGDFITAAITALTKTEEFKWDLYFVAKAISMLALIGGCGFIHTLKLSLGFGTATPIARAAIARFLSKREVEQRFAEIVYDTGLNEDITDIQKIIDELSSKNPAYMKEFHDFEKLCIEALKKAIEKIPKNVLDHIFLRLNFNEVISVAYERTNDNHLETLINSAFQDVNEADMVGITGAGFNAFALLEQHQVIDSLMSKLVDELHTPSFDCYTSAKLVNIIVHEILTQEWQTFTETRKNTTEEKNKLTAQKDALDRRKVLEKDAEKVKDLRVELSYIRDEIDEKDSQITILVKQIEKFNTKIRTIDGISPDTIAPAIQFLNGRVFRTDTVFEILDVDEEQAKNIFNTVPLHPSLEILRSAYVAAFTHLYDASSKRASHLEHSSNAIVEISRTGDGSLIPAFWVKYITKIATANGLDIRKTVELAKLKITEIDEQQKEELSALESEILGVKTSVPADGDCYFTSVARSIGLEQHANVTLRQMTIDHIINNRASYEPLITHSTFDEYIKIYRSRGAWNETRDGNDIMVPALAEKLGVHMVIHDEMHGGMVRSINGGQKEAPVIHLSYTGAHYIPYIAADLTHLKSIKDRVINYVSPKKGNDIGVLRSPDTLYAKSRNLLPSVNDMATKNSSAGPK